MSNIIKKFESFIEFRKLNESTQDAGFAQTDDKLNLANTKVRRAIIWISINQPTYAELIALVTIYATYELPFKTMATDGRNIMFDPDFVLQQKDEAIRFVLCHEVLHCMMDHHKRRGRRNPSGWNIACDYAINPILCEENGKPAAGFAWPVIDGKTAGLYRKDLDGLSAEHIWDLLKKEESLDNSGKPTEKQQASPDEVRDADASEPKPAGEPIQKGQFEEEDGEGEGEEDGDGEGKEEGDEYGKEDGYRDGKEEGDGDSKKRDNNRTAKIGDKVRLNNGSEALVKKVYPDGSIEI